MKLAIQIDGHAASSRAANTAYQFIKAALAKNHRIILVFFYYDGVLGALPGSGVADDITAPPRWAELVRDHGLDLVVCSAAAERRGIRGRSPHPPDGPEATALSPDFHIGGLGQWVDACLRCDRMVRFAA